MDLQTHKLQLIQWLATLDDVASIKKVEQVRAENVVASPQQKMTEAEYFDMFGQSEQARQEGRVISLEELEKEIEKW